MNLNRLYCRVLNRLNTDSFIYHAKIFIKSEKLKYTIISILKNINKRILIKKNLSFIKKKFYKKLKFTINLN